MEPRRRNSHLARTNQKQSGVFHQIPSFITPNSAYLPDNNEKSKARKVGHRILKTRRFELTLAVLIILNLVLVVIEADAVAIDSRPPQWSGI